MVRTVRTVAALAVVASAALDALRPVLDAPYLAGVEPACTKKCREDAGGVP
jgi:hypothetical protein